MASLSLRNIYKVYPNGFNAVKDFNLEIEDKEFIIFVGPSGCGKSTTLRMIAGLEEISKGELYIDDKLVNDVEPKDRDIAMVFQSYALYPHMSIYDNITFGCRIHGMRNKKTLDKVVEKYLRATGLWDEVKDRLHTPASALSIGQQQRLCLARGLAVEPQFILADESTSALDPISSKNIEDLFMKLRERYGIIMVTHTLRQALRIADYVIFMYMGEMIEQGTADELFNHPKHDLTKQYLSGVFS